MSIYFVITGISPNKHNHINIKSSIITLYNHGSIIFVNNSLYIIQTNAMIFTFSTHNISIYFSS